MSWPHRTPGLLAFCTFSMDWKACLTALGWWILLLGLWILLLTCPMDKWSSFLRNSSCRRTIINPTHENKNSRLVEMTLGLVHAIYGLPKWRAEYRLRVCLHDLKYWNKLNLTQDEIKQFLKNVQSLFVYPLVHQHLKKILPLSHCLFEEINIWRILPMINCRLAMCLYEHWHSPNSSYEEWCHLILNPKVLIRVNFGMIVGIGITVSVLSNKVRVVVIFIKNIFR